MDREQYIINTRKNIELYGRSVIAVFNNEYDEDVYTYFYSIGNPGYQFICFHPTEIGAEIIHKVACKVARHPQNYNLRYERCVDLPGLLCDYHVDDYSLPYEQLVRLRRIRGVGETITRQRYLKANQWDELQEYNSNEPIIQILLSDENNLFAGDDGVNEVFNEWVPQYLRDA